MPSTSACFNVSNLALCGIPFLAGFYSKDIILEIVRIRNIYIFSYFFVFFSPVYLKLLTLLVFIFGGLLGYLTSITNLYSLNKSLLNYNLVTFLGSM